MAYLGAIAGGFKTLITGLSITARQIRRKSVTLQYPHQKPELSKAFRSAIRLVRFDDIDTHDCVACMQCVNICPSFCITIEGQRVEGIKRMRATRVEMDFALCSLCGLCIDVCPTDTLEYSKIYDEAGTHRNWNFDLLDEFRADEEPFIARQREIEAKEAAEKKARRAAADAAKAKASGPTHADADRPPKPDSAGEGEPAR